MEFISSLKETAHKIIELSSQLGDRTHTWNQEESAPAGGYTDRAGLIVFDNVELFADVYVSEDESDSLLRARLAWSPKGKDDQDLFTIITLDFNTVPEKAKAIIANTDNLTPQTLVSLLNDPSTSPKLIHVSYEFGKDSAGNDVGKRYEYSTNDLRELGAVDQTEFINTLNLAYDQIVSNI